MIYIFVDFHCEYQVSRTFLVNFRQEKIYLSPSQVLNTHEKAQVNKDFISKANLKYSVLLTPFIAWFPMERHTYLNKPAPLRCRFV